MQYLALGLMCGSSMDGVDIAYVEFKKNDEFYSFNLIQNECTPYDAQWRKNLSGVCALPTKYFLELDAQFGIYLGALVNRFLVKNNLPLPHVIALHGHTTFHNPDGGISFQLGSGAHVAAMTKGIVVSDLRTMDIALNGQGAPLVPMGEQLLFPEQKYFLNIGGIANLSIHQKRNVVGFDVCPANSILNYLARQMNKSFDEDGALAASGAINSELLNELNLLDFYKSPPPKSLANQFATEKIKPILDQFKISLEDQLCTYVEHISIQIINALDGFLPDQNENLMITGGGAFNKYLIQRIAQHLQNTKLTVALPIADVIEFKEAIIMALLAVLRLENTATTLPSVTGAKKLSIGGAIWNGHEPAV